MGSDALTLYSQPTTSLQPSLRGRRSLINLRTELAAVKMTLNKAHGPGKETRMITKRITTITVRWLLSTVFTCYLFAVNVRAQDAPAADINGVYNGSYVDAQGTTKFKLSLTENANGMLAGVFTFYLPGGSDTNAYTRDLLGHYIPGSRLFALRAGKWETVPPGQVVMMGMNGIFDPGGGEGAGKISGKMLARPGAPFEAIRDAAESANLAGMIAARKAAGPPVASAAPASQPPAAAAVQTPPSAQAPGLQLAPSTAINGVYNGTYSCVNGSVNLKLSLKSTGNGVLTGFFTFDLPPDAGGSRATYKLTGRYAWGVHQFVLTAQAVGTPAPSEYSMSRVSGSYVAGSDWIEGRLNGPACDSFHATRDKAESANLDGIMAAQAGAGAQQLVLAQPPKAPVASPNQKPGARGKHHGAPVTASSPAAASTVQTAAAAEPGIPVTSVKDYLALTSGQQTKLFDAIVHELAAKTKDAPRVLKRFTGDPNVGLMDFDGDISSLKKQAALGQVDLAQTNVQSLVQGTIDFYVHTDIEEDMTDPKDTKWVDELDLDRPATIKALFTGDFSHVAQLRGQVLTYIAALNDNLFSINCTNLYDSTISDAATAQASGGTASSFMSGLGNGGNMSALRMNLERQQMDTDSGASDAETLYFNGPQDCDNTLWKKIIQNMRTYVQSQ
jgi:hypothetical protein